MGVEHTGETDTTAELVDKSTAQGRHSGLRPDNPGSPGQPSRLESLARARTEKDLGEDADEQAVDQPASPPESRPDSGRPSASDTELDQPEPAESPRSPTDSGTTDTNGQVPDPVRDGDDDLAAWMAAAERIAGKVEPAEPAGTDAGEKIEISADRLDIPEDLKSEVEYGHPQETDDHGTRYELPLFDGAAKREDARQGALGDCGVIAAIGAVAGTAPDKIMNSVRGNDDGTVSVTLHEAEFRDRDVTAPTGRIIDITVSRDVPVFTQKTGETAFAQCTRAGVTWPGYAEKALGAVDETWPPDRGQNPLLGNVSERGYARLDKWEVVVRRIN